MRSRIFIMVFIDTLCWTFVLLCVGSVSATWTSAGEFAIRSSKLGTSNSYDRMVRPVNTVAVKAGLNILALDTLDVKSMTLTMTGWLTVDWTDSRLTWTVDATNTADHFYALDTEIWKPELFIDNSKENVQILNDPYLQFKVDKDGVVEWELPLIFQSHCEVDVTYYPFDTQTCIVELTSWAYTMEEIALTPLYDVVKTDNLETHGEWSVVGSEVKTKDITETKASGAVKTYPVIDFEIKLRRKPSYYITGVILPVFLVAFLQIVVFILPVDSGEKIGFSITMLLALAVLLTLVIDSMPSSAVNISILSVYLAMTLVLGVVCVSGTVIVIIIHFREEEKMVPKWVRKMMVCCCIPISCWRGCSKKNKVSAKLNTNQSTDDSFSFDNDDQSLSWKDISAIVDWVFFVILSILTTCLSVACVLALLIGGYV